MHLSAGNKADGCDAVDIQAVRKDKRVDTQYLPVGGPIRLLYPREMGQVFC